MVSAAQLQRPATRWPAVALITGSGMVAALQVGKAVIAAPLLQADLGISLAGIGWLTGIFAALGLIGGIPAGAMVASRGGRRILILGLAITAIGTAMGAMAAGFPLLLISRVIEGAGFLLITVAAPSILPYVTDPSDRDTAFALWACFMPAGMALAMLAGPLFDGWRMIWWASLAATVLIGLAVVWVIPEAGQRTFWSWGSILTDTGRILHARQPITLAGLFALYSLMFFALFSFLPVLLIERMEVSLSSAGLFSALATAACILGNLAAGTLLTRGAPRRTVIAGASLVMGLCGFGIFPPVLPDALVFALCLIFSITGGLIPATLLATAPLVAPGAALVPVVLGLCIQGSNLGQILGPVVVGGVIEGSGWGAAALLVAAAALLSVLAAMKIRAP